MTNTNLLTVINNLPSGTMFSVSIAFFAKFGYHVTKGDIIRFGRFFANNYSYCNCSIVQQSNRGQVFLVNSKNHRVYLKH